MSWVPGEDLVTDLRRALARAPHTSAEDRFEAWAWRALLDEDGPGLLTRDAVPSHVTASAFVLSGDLERTCLVLHGKINAWVQPGGHLEPGDLAMAGAAAREMLEETGLTGQVHPDPVQLSRHRAPCRPGIVDWHLDVQYAVLTEEIRPAVSQESLDVAWFELAALPHDLAPGVRDGVVRAVRCLRSSGYAGPDQPADPADPTDCAVSADPAL
jgi:8-oxo-dGTP pyrophosphatase MutT (NUDIX family)